MTFDLEESRGVSRLAAKLGGHVVNFHLVVSTEPIRTECHNGDTITALKQGKFVHAFGGDESGRRDKSQTEETHDACHRQAQFVATDDAEEASFVALPPGGVFRQFGPDGGFGAVETRCNATEALVHGEAVIEADDPQQRSAEAQDFIESTPLVFEEEDVDRHFVSRAQSGHSGARD